MIFGSPWGCGWGDPDRHVASADIATATSGAALRVRFTPADGFGDAWFGIYVNSRLAMTVWADEDRSTGWLFVPSAVGKQSVMILRHGTLADMDLATQARYLESGTSARARLAWTWAPEIVTPAILSGGGPDTYLTSWSLSGVSLGNTQTTDLATRRTLTVDLTVSAGTGTVSLYRGTTLVASGSAAVGASATLAEQNDSGISGSVTIDAGATTQAGATLTLRWPASMSVLRDTSDPPTTVRATVPFSGLDSGAWVEASDLAAGTYYYRLRPTSDTGTAGTATASATVTIAAPPGAPSGLAYASGAAAATVLSFTGSATSGATYRLYLRDIGDAFLDTINIAATAAAGATTITMPAITGYAGTVRALLRAVKSGVEEKNGVCYCDIEYDAGGVRVAPRPNTPLISSATITGGGVSVVGYVLSADQSVAATSIKLYTRTISGSYNFASPDGTATLGAEAQGRKTATVTASGLSGWRYLTLKSASAAGTLSDGYATEQLCYFSTSTVPTAGDFVATASRG